MGLVVAVGIGPRVVVPVHAVIIMYAFVVAVVDGREGYGEAVLPVSEPYLLGCLHAFADGLVEARRDEVVVHLEVLQHQARRAIGRDVLRIEHRQSVGASKDERAVGQPAGGAVVELEAAYAVGLVVDGDVARVRVHLVQAVHRAHPEVAAPVLLHA